MEAALHFVTPHGLAVHGDLSGRRVCVRGFERPRSAGKTRDSIRLGVLTSSHTAFRNYALACEELGVPYRLVEVTGPDWMRRVREADCDGYLAWSPNDYHERHLVYMEKLYFINKVFEKPIYPSFEELYLDANKRATSYFLEAMGLPHPRTWVFTDKEQALEFFQKCDFPVVVKANIGVGAKGVEFVRSRRHAERIVRHAFGWKSPKRARGHHKIEARVLGVPKPRYGKLQRHYLLVQQYEEIKWEWRIIRIGRSSFGHQKLLDGDFASGSDKVGWVAPPEQLLWMVRELSEQSGFLSPCADIFETVDGRFLINELQSLIGQYADFQMRIDDKPGRYVDTEDGFRFEEGVFNRFSSCLLRVEHFVELLTLEATSRPPKTES
jgi:hypothetical protein